MTAVLPLLALRAFTEVGRRGSVKAAAQSMGVSPGAVSQQIRILEDRVGFSLFLRTSKGIKLTARAERVYETLQISFDNIDKSLKSLRAMQYEHKVSINTTPAFAASWLIPKLTDFYSKFPHIEISIESSNELVDLKRSSTDIALRHGLGNYPGLSTMRLIAPRLIPVAAPGLLANGPAINTVEDCLNYPLLQDSDRADWHLWLQAHGIDDDVRARKGPSFEDDFLLARAAATGQGMALVPEFCVEEELREGKLCVALEKTWPARFAYYAVTLPETLRRSEIREVLSWLIEQTTQEEVYVQELAVS
ncbi:LysR family transcriptional regulator [Pseudomonas tussilaginis]|uniref:LysR substrate-binding domain-containing protein n=1 Tax=unclassified Pseudomonas TaxID=196821 RepID=UPI000C6E3D67|nr:MULTISPECIES: LysR substrate-binding domain-containing protein [unclassified Pseudomonas]QYX49817.1 LysR family transcriptional regulator [Pseudomonas sp. S11A 273]